MGGMLMDLTGKEVSDAVTELVAEPEGLISWDNEGTRSTTVSMA